MHLMYTSDESGKRVYTLKKVLHGEVTKSAHPARFSPDDKWSRQRVTLKKLQIIQADPERNLILVKGSVPGARGGLLMIKKHV